MHISKCDSCHKEILRGSARLSVTHYPKDSFGWQTIDLCAVCGDSTLRMLKRKKIISLSKENTSKK